MRIQQRTLGDVALIIHVWRGTLGEWFATRDRAIRRKTIEEICHLVGIEDVAHGRRLAGGHTAEDKQAETGRRTAALNRPAKGSEKSKAAHEKTAAKQTGKRQPPDAIAQRSVTMRARGRWDIVRKKNAERWGTPNARVEQSLRAQLHRMPLVTDEEMRAVGQKTAGRFGVCYAEVMALLNNWRRAHARAHLFVRSSTAARCRAMRDYFGSVTHTTYGMWKNAPDTPTWSEEHARVCPELANALARVRGANRTERLAKAISTREPESPFFGSEDAAMLGGNAQLR